MKASLIPFLIALSLFSAQASERRFAFSYPSLTSPLHELELENSVTLKLRPGSQRTFAFKHELEYGLTEKRGCKDLSVKARTNQRPAAMAVDGA